MPWGRLDDALHQNGKVLSFSDKAFRVWLYSISFCNAKYYRDESGALSEDEAGALCRLAGAPQRVVEELVAKRGWDRTATGYLVHDYPQYGPFLDRTNAERQARFRAKHRPDNGPSNGGVTRYEQRYVTPPIPIPSPMPSPTPPPEEETASRIPTHDDPADRRARVSFADDEFSAWWTAYPRHEAKKAARASYAKRRAAGRSAESLLAAAQQYATHVALGPTPIDKVAHATTFLNQHRDEDWEHGPPDRDRAPARTLESAGVGRYFADYRSAAQKAAEPVPQWRQINWREDASPTEEATP